jgi:hypothetical protein
MAGLSEGDSLRERFQLSCARQRLTAQTTKLPEEGDVLTVTELTGRSQSKEREDKHAKR